MQLLSRRFRPGPVARSLAWCAVLLAATGMTSAATLSLPDNAIGAPSSTVVLSVAVTPADGILGLDLRLDFSSSVLQPTSVTTTTISQGFSLTYNMNTPGRVLVSLFSSTPMVGSGPVVDVHFNVVGALGATTGLDLVSAQINEGAIVATLDDGLFTVCAGGFPAEVGGLSINGASSTSVTWTGQGVDFHYDVASGSTSGLRTDGGSGAATCLSNDTAAASFVDPRPAPPGGTAYYYIVRSQNFCGTGTYGFASSGAERLPLAACP